MDFWRKLWFERTAPIAVGLVVFCTVALLRDSIAAQFSPTGWQAANLYNAVFNWASIQSGFVFGIYGFIATKRDGFVGEIFGGRSFQQLLSYARRAYVSGFILTFASLPLMVINPQIGDAGSLKYWIVAVWFASFAWTFCAFLRVAFIFGIVVAVPDKRAVIVG